MSTKFESLTESHISFIERQSMFFVATAPEDTHINLSPKGLDSFRVLNPQQIVWLNLTGSGNETAAHVNTDSRMTIMFCSFTKESLILRLYGQARCIHPRDRDWDKLLSHFPEQVGARQLFLLDLDLVQTSCGYGVPYFDQISQRPSLTKWAAGLGREGIEAYWQEKNTKSLDGTDTGINSAQ